MDDRGPHWGTDPTPMAGPGGLGRAGEGLILLAFVLAALPALFVLPPLPPANLAAGLLLAAALIVLAVIDLRTLRLPDVLTLPLVIAGLFLAWLLDWDSVGQHALAALAGFAGLAGIGWVYERLRGRAGLGLGDAKLLAASGAWVGLDGLASVILIACGVALVTVAAGMTGGRSLDARIPFGPFLAFGTWLTWLYGPVA